MVFDFVSRNDPTDKPSVEIEPYEDEYPGGVYSYICSSAKNTNSVPIVQIFGTQTLCLHRAAIEDSLQQCLAKQACLIKDHSP